MAQEAGNTERGSLVVQKTESRGLKTSWIESGDRGRPLLVCLHGYPDTARVWEPLFQELSQDFHLVAPFMRGCESDPIDLQRFKRDSQSMDLMEVLRVVNVKKKPVFLLGHDLGAVHAWHLAGLLGAELQGLILVNGISLGQYLRRLKNPRQLLKSWYIPWMQVPGFAELLMKKAPWLVQVLARTLGECKGRTPEISRFGFRSYRALARELFEKGLTASLRDPVQVPVLVVWGARDSFLEVPQDGEFHAPHVELKILEDQNHWFFVDQPQLLANAIRDFSKGPLC